MLRLKGTRMINMSTSLALLSVLLAPWQGSVAGQDSLAFAESRISVGDRPASVLIVDANRDGITDIIVANSGDGTITVLLGDGSGGFAGGPTTPAGETPVDLAPGDFDEDGWVDLAIANHETDYVTFLFGTAEGGFESRSHSRLQVGVSPHPHAVVVEDLDGDGHADLIVDDRTPERLRVFRGGGDGRFEAAQPIPVGGDPYRGMLVRDLNGDGHLDVATPNPTAVMVLHGDGTGRFSIYEGLQVPRLRPFSVGAADVNGDGVLDLGVGSGEGAGMFAIWRGAPGTGFRLAPGSQLPMGDGPITIGAGDVNGDGLDDFIVNSYAASEVAIVLGGGWEPRIIRREVPGNPWGIATGDLNGDGRTDFVTANHGSDDVSVFLSPGG